MMSKKHFEKIAGILSGALASYGDVPLAHNAIEQIADELAGMFEDENPRFERELFLRAAGVL